MKKDLVMLLFAIVAVSMLSAAAVVTIPAAASEPCTPYKSPNPTPVRPAQWGSTVNVRLRVSPTTDYKTPNSQRIILVTLLYDKKKFDPYMGAIDLQNTRFGRTGTEATPIAQYQSDVNHDGYKDLTLAFYAHDTGLRAPYLYGRLIGQIHNVCGGAYCNCPAVVLTVYITGNVW